MDLRRFGGAFLDFPLNGLSNACPCCDGCVIRSGLLPRLLISDEVRSGKLMLWGVQDGAVVEIWALFSSRRLLSAKVRTFMNWLVAELPPKAG